MDSFVTFLNTAGKSFVSFAGSMLIQSSILIAVLLVVDLILRKKVRAVFRYWIWMLVLVKLVLPTTLSSPTGPGYWFGDKLPSVVIEKSSTTEQSATISPIVEPTSETALPEMDITASPLISTLPKPTAEVATESIAAIPAQQAVSLSWYGFAFMGWSAVVTAMVLLLLQRMVFVSGLIAQAKSAGNLMTDVFEYCCRQMGLKGKVGLKVSANATSPAVCGLFRPVILVPGDLAPSLGASRLRAVLLHELAHIKRGDLWVSLVQTVLQIVYFYNPLLWAANFVIRRIREQAVDEAVQVVMGERARKYPQTLVEVAKLTFKRPTLSLRLTGVVESKSALKGRIKRMLGQPIPRSAKLGIAGLLAVIVAGAVLLPMAGAEKSKETTEVAQQQSEFKATLSNGVTVELLGICQYPSEGKQWWRPDGTLLEQVIVTEDNSNYTSKGKSFEIAYKINAPNDITVGWPHIRGSTAQSGLIVKEPGGIKAVRVHINKWGSTTTVGFGIADGEWTLLGKADGKGQTYSSIGSRKLMFGPAINTGNKITLTVSDTLESNNDYRLIAVDKLGKIIEATRNWFSVERLRQSTFTFTNLSQDIIDHFEFQSRPYKLVEFKNVSLKPNFKTDVQIKVKSEKISGVVGVQDSTLGKSTSAEAAFIIQKVLDRYAAIKTYSAIGELLTDVDHPLGAMGAMPGMTTEMLQQMGEQQLKSIFTIKIARPNLYCIEWSENINTDLSKVGNAWSAGDGSYGLIHGKEKSFEKPLRALIWTANNMGRVQSSLFFDTSLNTLRELRDLSQQEDKQLEGVDCYVISGSRHRTTYTYWVSKKDFLIRRCKFVSGGDGKLIEGGGHELTDETIKESLKAMDKEATPEEIAKMRAMLTAANAMASEVKVTNTETYRNIILDQPISKEQFVPSKDVDEITEELKKLRAKYVHRLKNISPTEPNFKTDVEIEVEKPAVQVEGEARDVRAEKMSSLPGSEQKNITIQAKVFSVKSNTDAVRDFLANKLKLNGVSTDKPWLEPAILTDIEADNFSNYMSLQPDVSLLVSPKVRAFDGEKAEMQVTDRDEYVTGYEAGKPKKEEFVTGVEFSFTPKLRKDNKAVTLKVDFKKTDLVEVVKKTDESGHEINIPMIDIQSVSTTVVVPEGNSILIPVAGMQRPVADSAMTCQIILLVKADVQVEGERTKEISDADKMVSEDLAAEGWRFWRQRKLAEAEKVFKEAVAKDPTNAGAWNGLGWSQLNRGKRLNAKVSFQNCLEIEPNHSAALNGLGWIAKGEKKIDEAIGYWEKAVESAPGATAALSGLTQTYMELKQYDNAIKYYQMWLKVEPDNAQAKTGLEKAKVEKAAGQVEGDILEEANENQVKTIVISVVNEEAGTASVFDFSTEKTTDIKLSLDKFALKERIDRFFQAFFASSGDISFEKDNDILLMNSGRMALLSLEQLSDAFQISLDKLIAHIRAVDLENEEMSRVPSLRVGTLKIGKVAALMTGDGIVAAIEGGQFDAESQKREIKYIILGQVDINDLPEPQFLVETGKLIAESMVERAAYALARDDVITARFLAKHSAELKPELTDALLIRGMVYVKTGEYDKGRGFYERALELYKSTNNFNRQSLVLKLLGRDSEAEALYSEIDPNFKEPISAIFNDELKPMDFALPADKAALEVKKEK